MTRRRGGIATALVASVLVAVIVSGSGSAQSPGGRTIKLFERDKGSRSGIVDNPPKSKSRRRPRISIGDLVVLTSPVLDEAKQQRLGRISEQCAVTSSGTERTGVVLCHGAFVLGDGQITFEMAVPGAPKTMVGAVTGGTGAYIGARGTFASTNVKGGSEDTLTLLP